MIVMDDEDGTEVLAPVLLCDGCGERIVDPGKANALWLMDPQAGHPVRGSLAVVHCIDWPCSQVYEAEHGRHYWRRLEELLPQLLRNVGFDPRLTGF
jgi:hypothetical protein